MNDQSDVAAAVGGKLPERPDYVVLDCEPGSNDISFAYIFLQPLLIKTEILKTFIFIHKSYSLVYREVFLAHHELQVVYDDVVDVIHVDGVLHGVQDCPIGKVGQVTKPVINSAD